MTGGWLSNCGACCLSSSPPARPLAYLAPARRQLKKEAPGRMAALYLEAMKAAYGRAEAALGEEEGE